MALEVMDMSRIKGNWKEKAAPVIKRLGNVCPHWKSILATNFFRNELHRTFEGRVTWGIMDPLRKYDNLQSSLNLILVGLV